jgi:hypothetical protein
MRNPDYLADELLDEYEAGRRSDAIPLVRSILEDQEPDLRRLPMARHLFGAYEPLDDALALLSTPALISIRVHRFANDKVGLWEYFLSLKGEEAAAELVAQAPHVFGWYDDRAQLVASLAGGTGGSGLKRRQYLKQTYKDTPVRQRISSIADRVQQRLEGLEE